MKQLLITASFIIGMALGASAQTTGDQGSGTNHISSGSSTATHTKGKKGMKKKKVVNQRVNYHSPKTGQTATPTGQEATGINGGESPNPKNAAKSDSTRQ